MKQNIHTTLGQLGLSEMEILIYLQLLQMGTMPASTIAKRMGLNRSTVRYTLENLAQKRLCLQINKNNTMYFTPEDPEKILLLLKAEQRELEVKQKAAEGIIGELQQLKNPHTNVPRVQFFEGKDGLKKAYEKILSLKQDVDSFEEGGQLYSLIPECAEWYVAERIKNGSYNRVICPAGSPLNDTNAKNLLTAKQLDSKEFPFTMDVKICGDHVQLTTFDESPVGVVIEHPEIAKNFRVLFEYLWSC